MPVSVRGSLLAFALPLFVSWGCGARTAIELHQAAADASIEAAPAPECTRDLDCEGADDMCAPVVCSGGRCVAQPEVVCDDRDPCTDDVCDPATGLCAFPPRTLDLDGDGHRAPLPGKRPGEPGSCGDDCDDRSASAFPGNVEACDGVDNDCNGVVDDSMTYVPLDPTVDALRISEPGTVPAGPAGLTWSGASYLAVWNGTTEKKTRVLASFLDEAGTKTGEQRITHVTADAFEGRVVWTGAHYGVAWSDRRTGSWEVWFNRLNAKGEKLGPDVLVSEGEDSWSINLSLAWTGKEFVLAWQDQRELNPDFGIWGQRLDVDGKKLGPNTRLVAGQGGAPELAVGLGTIAMAWTETLGKRHDVEVAIFDRELRPKVEPFRVTTPAVSGVFPVITWNADRYVVAFYDPDGAKKAIFAAAYDESGAPVVPLRQVTESPKFSRYPSLLPLGDRLLLTFSDTKDANGGYELYTKMLDRDLGPLGPEQRITRAKGDSVFPVAAFGPDGDVGVLFRDDRLGALHTWFTRLVCRGE